MTAQRLLLNPDIHICPVDNVMVMLDARRNEYSLIDSERASWIKEIFSSRDLERLSPEAENYRRLLAESSLFTTDTAFGKPLKSCDPPSVQKSIYDDLLDIEAILDAKQIATFCSAFANCLLIDRTRPFFHKVRIAEKWKRRSANMIAPKRSLEDVRQLVRNYEALCPFFFTVRDACLFRSFLLVDFLRRQRIAVDWVFGVRISPFAAHSWVECDRVALNENLDTVAEYHQILSI